MIYEKTIFSNKQNQKSATKYGSAFLKPRRKMQFNG